MCPPPLSAAQPVEGGPLPVAAGEPVTQRQARTNLFMSASLAAPGQASRDVRVRNLSATGARIDCADPPPQGTPVLLCRGSAKVSAEVMWASPASCGLRFAGTIDVPAWISDRPGAGAAAREELSLAEELAVARQLVARLEEAIATQPVAVALMGAELQALDLLAQLLRLAEAKASGAPVPALRNVREAATMFVKQSAGAGLS